MKKIEVEKKFWSQVHMILDLIFEIQDEMDLVPAGELDKEALDDLSDGIYKLYKQLEVKVAALKAVDLHHEIWTASEFHNLFYNGLEEITISRANMQSKMWAQVRLHKAYQAM